MMITPPPPLQKNNNKYFCTDHFLPRVVANLTIHVAAPCVHITINGSHDSVRTATLNLKYIYILHQIFTQVCYHYRQGQKILTAPAKDRIQILQSRSPVLYRLS